MRSCAQTVLFSEFSSLQFSSVQFTVAMVPVWCRVGALNGYLRVGHGCRFNTQGTHTCTCMDDTASGLTVAMAQSPVSLCADYPSCPVSSVDGAPCAPGNFSSCECLIVNTSRLVGKETDTVNDWNQWENTQAWVQLVTSVTSLLLSLSFMLTFVVWPGRMMRYVRPRELSNPLPWLSPALLWLTDRRALGSHSRSPSGSTSVTCSSRCRSPRPSTS